MNSIKENDWVANQWLKIKKGGRGGQIRTDDFLLPKQALYQAELRPVRGRKDDYFTKLIKNYFHRILFFFEQAIHGQLDSRSKSNKSHIPTGALFDRRAEIFLREERTLRT